MLQQTISNILDCKNTIETYQFDEAATKQYIVLPILRALDWQDSNLYTLEVFPEKLVGNGKVDYALQRGDNIFVVIECKRWGENIERHQEQICLYAFMAGVGIAVITNGKIWDFYLPDKTSLPGRVNVPWQDRIFCSIDLEARHEAIFDFQKYLTKSHVEQGQARTEAEEAFQPQRVDTPLPRQRYCLPILKALEILGGTAATSDVLTQVFQLMNNELRSIDKSRRSDGQFYWENRAHDMRRELVNKELMKDDSPRGIWEISEEGREYLRTNEN